LDRIFLTTVSTIEKELLQTCRALQVYLFQASSKFQATCVVFHLFSFESLASFKNKRSTEKVKRRTDIFYFFFTWSLAKKHLQHFEARVFAAHRKTWDHCKNHKTHLNGHIKL
jgi:hypothetical protein